MITYDPTQTRPEVKLLPILRSDGKHTLNFGIGDIKIRIRPEINLISHSDTTLFMEGSHTPYSNEIGQNYIAVSLDSNFKGNVLKNISGKLYDTKNDITILPEHVYYSPQQGCIPNFLTPDEFIYNIRSDKYLINENTSIEVRKSNNFAGIKRWTDDKSYTATSCINFVYSTTINSTDIDAYYEMLVGTLVSSDGKEHEIKIYLEPVYYLHKRYN